MASQGADYGADDITEMAQIIVDRTDDIGEGVGMVGGITERFVESRKS